MIAIQLQAKGDAVQEFVGEIGIRRVIAMVGRVQFGVEPDRFTVFAPEAVQ